MKDFLYILKEYINTKDDCIYLVGGTVRDIKAGRNISDYDFAVCKNFDNAANYFASKVKGSYVKMHEDTSRVVKDGVIFDFSKLKGNTIHEDLRKRDFTIDSMAIDLRDKSFIDDTGGLNDLMNKKIRVTYDEAFKDDGARILRAFRLYAVLGFEIDLNTLKLIKINAPMLSLIPGERMLSEIIKIFESKRAYDTLSLMDKEGVLKKIFSQVEPLKKKGKRKKNMV
ncbi:MAG TPA: tRNA nucleotidyltransferase, partial [Clostridiaceae bacterium]|nr:tRNA nucleotidyltransferase [Clostridiaceae bacterium]